MNNSLILYSTLEYIKLTKNPRMCLHLKINWRKSELIISLRSSSLALCFKYCAYVFIPTNVHVLVTLDIQLCQVGSVLNNYHHGLF